MSTPAISVAMSVYNGERFLAEAIESVLTQSFTDFEFLIVDDGSTDSSRATIEAFALADSRIRPIFRENRGLIASLNQLIEEARAPIIARMDADDVCHPERLAKQIAFLDANPDYGVIGAWSEDIDEAGRPLLTAAIDHPIDHAAFLDAVERDSVLLCHPVVTYRREVVRGVGGYHAAFRHCEDFDLWLRLASATRLGNLPERLLRYRHSEGQVSRRHAVEQAYGAEVARLAYAARRAGRPDPTADLERLPPIGELDVLFGCPGASNRVAVAMARALLYSRTALRSEGFDLVMRLAREGDDRPDLWRTVARLLRFGAPVRAARLAAALSRAA